MQHYERQGYKGSGFFLSVLNTNLNESYVIRYHSEGSIVRTIFGLLFFDIIFASIPGAFETPYQSAPLDIAEDSFYFARRDLIDRRLDEIEGGAAARILARIDEEHRDKKTWCVGVHWDLFQRSDLLEIIEVRTILFPSLEWLTDDDTVVHEWQMPVFHLSIVL